MRDPPDRRHLSGLAVTLHGTKNVADLGPMSCLKATRFLKGPSKIYGWVRITLNTRSRARLGHNRSGLLVVFK